MFKIKIKNIEFNNPIIASSGTFGYGYEVADFVDLSKLGCVVTKSITLEPRNGNSSPRIHESESGMINSIGLANVGVDKFCDNEIQKLNNINTKFIISIAGKKYEDYLHVIKKIENAKSNHVGYEVNVSCPNTSSGGMEFGVDAEMTHKLTSELRQQTDKLLIVKLSPNVTNIGKIALSAESAGADAISAVNTFVGLSIDYKTGKFILSNKFGGVSGPAIKPMALAKVYQIFKEIKIPIIGMGGISSFKDVIEFIRAGATMVQIGTLNYRDPTILSTFNNQIEDFLKSNNIDSISDLIGRNYEN
tara:strand:+ start:173 stop:1084 length:912 start_codon:yes stop_codon:yes gene_type:complete